MLVLIRACALTTTGVTNSVFGLQRRLDGIQDMIEPDFTDC